MIYKSFVKQLQKKIQYEHLNSPELKILKKNSQGVVEKIVNGDVGSTG